MTKTKTKVLAIAVATVMTAGIAGAALSDLADYRRVEALDATSTVTYPFATGADAFKSAPTFIAPTQYNQNNVMDGSTPLGTWEYVEPGFGKTVNLTSATYIAVQLRIDKGNPGLTMGLIENADRFRATSADNGDDESKRAPVYLQKEDGTIIRKGIRYDAINFTQGECGTLYIPMSSMGWQWNNSNSNLTKVKSFYYTANDIYNWNYEITIGEIGYYTGDPAESATLTKLIDLSNGELPRSRYYIGAGNTTMSFPSDKAMPKIPYAFAEGADAYKNTVNWKPTAANETLTVTFDEATADLSDATHLLVQYFSTQAPRLQFTLSDGTKKSAIAASKRVFFMPMGANYSDWFVNTNANGFVLGMNKGMLMMGMVIVPIENLANGVNLAAVSSLEIKTGGATDVIIGGVASYTAERGDGAYADGTATKLLDLAASKFAKFTASAENTLTELQAKPNYNKMYGTSATVTQDVTYTGKTYNSEWSGEEDQNTAGLIWIGGSHGKVEMTKDTYQQDALKFTATAATGNGYTSTQDLGSQYSWAGAKGITLWARNDSEIEVSFNLEVECTAVVSKSNGNKQAVSDRFNVTQGNRFYLYDVNTGKTSIYMTRPTVSLPVGFEGWVFIPFTAFNRASWSNNGVTAETFMGENSYVNYLALSIEAAKNLNASFSVNSFGAYYKTPKFESAFVNANGDSIPELMGLNAQEEN